MGTISHHQAKAREFLRRADQAITNQDPSAAAVAFRRAATHVTTALAVHQGAKHKSRRQLDAVIHTNIAADNLSRTHQKTFRQVHTTSQIPNHGEPAKPRTNHPTKSNHPVNPVHPCKTNLRRLRRRVASLINHTLRLIAGNPKPVVHHKLWLREPDLPDAPNFTHAIHITGLPNYAEIRAQFRLQGVPLAADPDPHGFYQRGDTPRRCPCHADLWNKPKNPNRITLSPLWQRALEKTFRIRLPDQLQLAC